MRDIRFSTLFGERGKCSAQLLRLGRKSEEVSKMRNVRRVFFSILACLALAAAVWSLPPATTHANAIPGLPNNQEAAQQQSVSGKIASVEKNSFTLTVGQSQTSSERQNLEQDPATHKTMKFQIDKNTSIEGTLKVGANADVTYRQEKGANIAISVHVTP
jgi:hypothetical protein